MKALLIIQLHTAVCEVSKVPLRILFQTSNFLDRSSWRVAMEQAVQPQPPSRKAGGEDTERARYAEKVPLVIR